MSIGNPTVWMADVSKVCRSITGQAVIGFRDATYEQPPVSGTLHAVQNVLSVHLEQLLELIPSDFPQSRLSDLGRHIHFCHAQDCIDIAGFDIPDILQKAEEYAVAQIPTTPSGDVGDYLHTKFRARFDQELLASEPDFHALVLKSCVILGDTFKAKAGVTDDRDAEIGKAFKSDEPTLRVPQTLESQTDTNFQRGTMLLMQGARAFYRNTFSHSEIQPNLRQTVHALMLISMLTEIVEHSVKVDE